MFTYSSRGALAGAIASDRRPGPSSWPNDAWDVGCHEPVIPRPSHQVVIPRPVLGRHLHPVRAGAPALFAPALSSGAREAGARRWDQPGANGLAPARATVRAARTGGTPVRDGRAGVQRSCSAGGDLPVVPGTHKAAAREKQIPRSPSLGSGQALGMTYTGCCHPEAGFGPRDLL